MSRVTHHTCANKNDREEMMPTRVDRGEVPVYPDDLLPQLQSVLAVLADLEVQHEIQRDYLESWSGPRAVKERLLADLDQYHKANRERLEACLDRLRLQANGLASATPHRTKH